MVAPELVLSPILPDEMSGAGLPTRSPGGKASSEDGIMVPIAGLMIFLGTLKAGLGSSSTGVLLGDTPQFAAAAAGEAWSFPTVRVASAKDGDRLAIASNRCIEVLILGGPLGPDGADDHGDLPANAVDQQTAAKMNNRDALVGEVVNGAGCCTNFIISLCAIAWRATEIVGLRQGSGSHIFSSRNHRNSECSTVRPPSESCLGGRFPSAAA